MNKLWKEIDTRIDNFIEKWCGDMAPHLMDSDDNDGMILKEWIYNKLRENEERSCENG